MSQPKLTLRPPPHREFVQGFPGITGSAIRPPAHIAGNVEVRLGAKGLKAAWLRIELRKLETLPGGESWGELIGRGPIDVWSARKDDAYKSTEDKGWEILQTADFPFQVMIPEGLPPSAKLDKQAGIGYELVTSLCVRAKKGLLKKEVTSSIIQNTHPIVLEKHELHSTWPVYLTPEQHETIQDHVKVKLFRPQTCYGPGDQIDVRILVSSEKVSPVKLKAVSFSVRETITFRGGVKRTFGSKNAASQKTETLSSKSKSHGKKMYKGDSQTFDLSCLVPRNHTLMSIQTAKHIEVSYALRVQVDVGKKPIVMDHLPLTVSNFTTSTSEAIVDRIGFVPGLSTPGDSVTISSGDATTITRSQSFAESSFRQPYAGYSASDLRRRDTVMTQGTTTSGPGMAGRGVPGQVFSWGQYGSAQPFVQAAPRPAFAGPPSIFEGAELAPEENRALFHHSNRPQSAFFTGAGTDSSSTSARNIATIREASEEQGPQRQRSLSNPTLRHPIAQTAVPTSINSAEAEKERLYERARQQAERNQRRADERRAQAATSYRSSTPSSLRAPTPLDQRVPLSAAEEKAKLYERARAEAEQYQASFSQGAQFLDTDSRRESIVQPDPKRESATYWVNSSTPPTTHSPQPMSSSPQPQTASSSAAVSTFVSGKPVSYPTYISAEEEKRRLYEKAKAEAEAFQQGHVVERSGSSAVPVPGGWPREAPSTSQPTPVQSASSLSEKEQLRRYYEAQDAVARASASRFTPEPSAAATPHQPADTRSYLTEAEQQSAREKERLATHYAKKAARAQKRAEGGSLVEPPQPLKKDDPNLWRPRYNWLEGEDEPHTAAPPPIPPKIPLSRNASSTFLSR